MTQLPPELEIAINRAVEQFKESLIRMYSDGDIGAIVTDCGPNDIRIKATPVRKHEAVQIERVTGMQE